VGAISGEDEDVGVMVDLRREEMRSFTVGGASLPVSEGVSDEGRTEGSLGGVATYCLRNWVTLSLQSLRMDVRYFAALSIGR
jgi:hypothetical protein